jgi:hypothetical protein
MLEVEVVLVTKAILVRALKNDGSGFPSKNLILLMERNKSEKNFDEN